MKSTLLAGALCTIGTFAQAQSVVILQNNAWASCQYVLDNFESDEKLRSFMIDYVFGFLSGINAQRQVSGQPALDFAPINNPMLITWTVQVCNEDPSQSIHSAMFRLFGLLMQQQAGQ